MCLICLGGDLQSIPRDTVLTFLDEYMETPGLSTDMPEYPTMRAPFEACEDEIPLWPLSRVTEMP
jgi:hypothetical protein